MFGFRKRKHKLKYKIESIRKNCDDRERFEYYPVYQAFPLLDELCENRCELRIVASDSYIPTEAVVEIVGERKVIYEVINRFYINYGKYFTITETEFWV